MRVLLFFSLAAACVAQINFEFVNEEESENEKSFDREFLTGQQWFYLDKYGKNVGPMFFIDLKKAFFEGHLNLLTSVPSPLPPWIPILVF
jgi:hypothetical protein